MDTLYVFYDGQCALCARCREWVEGQPAYVTLIFVSFRSERARELCPEIELYEPDREIVVMADNGDIYQGGAAWVMCLWATRTYRVWAMRLASPALLPLAKKICHRISQKRLAISKFFKPVECENGSCKL